MILIWHWRQLDGGFPRQLRRSCRWYKKILPSRISSSISIILRNATLSSSCRCCIGFSNAWTKTTRWNHLLQLEQELCQWMLCTTRSLLLYHEKRSSVVSIWCRWRWHRWVQLHHSRCVLIHRNIIFIFNFKPKIKRLRERNCPNLRVFWATNRIPFFFFPLKWVKSPLHFSHPRLTWKRMKYFYKSLDMSKYSIEDSLLPCRSHSALQLLGLETSPTHEIGKIPVF